MHVWGSWHADQQFGSTPPFSQSQQRKKQDGSTDRTQWGLYGVSSRIPCSCDLSLSMKDRQFVQKEWLAMLLNHTRNNHSDYLCIVSFIELQLELSAKSFNHMLETL